MNEKTDKIWFTHADSGMNGWMVDRDGKQYIRLDIAGQEVYRPYSKSDWNPLRELRPLTPFHVGHIAFQADTALCTALGERKKKTEWLSLPPAGKREWMTGDGPGASADPKRQELYQLIRRHLKESVA